MEQEGGGEIKECALKEKATIFKYHPNKRQKNDLLLTLNGKKKMVVKRLQNKLKEQHGVKWYLCSKVQLLKPTPDGEDQVSTPHFRSACITSTNPTELEKQYQQAVEKIKTSFLEYQREGSGWQLDEVSFNKLTAFENPIFVHTYIYGNF